MGDRPSPSNVGIVVSVRAIVVNIRFDEGVPPIYRCTRAEEAQSPSRF